MVDFLNATDRADIAKEAEKFADILRADPDVTYDQVGACVLALSCSFISFLLSVSGLPCVQVVEINLSTLEPHLNGPFTPDLAHPISKMAAEQKKAGWIEDISAALIGSCTNSSYEDLTRSASIAKQALAKGLQVAVLFLAVCFGIPLHATFHLCVLVVAQDQTPHLSRFPANQSHYGSRLPHRAFQANWCHHVGQRLWSLHWPVEPHRCASEHPQYNCYQLQSQF